MKFWEQFKKKPNSEDFKEYHREKSQYHKDEVIEDSEVPEEIELRRQGADPDALEKLFKDPVVKARMEAELGKSSNSEKVTFQNMIGKGASTLGKSIKKVSSGKDLLDDENDEDEK